MNPKSQTVLHEIESDLKVVEGDPAPFEETNFTSRAGAVDFLDFHVIDRIEGLLAKDNLKSLEILKRRAEKTKHALEAIDSNLFERLREEIINCTDRQSSFRAMAHQYLEQDVVDVKEPDKIGYDRLDDFVNGLISHAPVPEPTLQLAPDMIFYQKAPARIIFEMAVRAEIKRHDVFFDVGSGLGQAVILMNLISGVSARGIEFEPAYHHYAKACASRLNLSEVEFINADARDGDYSEATIFFLYTPFEGKMLEEMLTILHSESLKRVIRIFTYGPCSSQVAEKKWLVAVNGNGDSDHKLYEFRSR